MSVPLMDMCISCNNFFLPPILLCPKGHKLCNHCIQDAQYMVATSAYNLRRSKLKSITKQKLFCGACINFYYADKELRNADLEKSLKSMKYPCIYKEAGCLFEHTFPTIKSHNETCSFMVISCFCTNCYWTGLLSDINSHLKDHSVIEIGTQQPFVNNSCHTFFVDEVFFSFKILLDQECAKFFVIYSGPPNKYRFEINIGARYCKKYPIKVIRTVPQLRKPKVHGFNPQNAEVIVVNLDFVEQFIDLDRQKVYSEIIYMMNVTLLDEENTLPRPKIMKLE